MKSENDALKYATESTPQMSADALTKIAAKPVADAVAGALKRAGERTGVSFELLYKMARRESALDPSAKAKTSSAAGLFQFIEQTWLGAVKAHGAEHGLGEAAAAIEQGADGRYRVADPEKRAAILNLRFDPEHAAALAGELVRDNQTALQAALGREVTGAELYAAHFFGANGAAKFLSAASEAIAADVLPSAAAANRAVFYDGARARSVSEVMASIEKSIGLTGGDPASDASRDPSLPAQATAPIAAPETKSAAFPFNSRSARRSTFQPPLRVAGSTRNDGARINELARLFSFRDSGSGGGLSPLAIAVLQALDPSALRADRHERG